MKKMRLRSFLFYVETTLLMVLLTSTANASQVITGRNDPAVDVQAVQAAVAKGGEVLLTGIFDFGHKGQVIIKDDVAISGESDEAGRPATKIKGGFWTFYSPLPSTEIPLEGPGPKITIRNIHFEGATWSPIHIPFTSGVEIVGNRIDNVQPSSLPIKWQGGDSVLVQTGVIVGTRLAHKDKYLPGAVSGKLIVANNHIDLKCEKPDITMGHGVFFPWTSGAVIEIRNNTFSNVSRNSIETLDNYTDAKGFASVTISGNDIVTPAKGCPFPGAVTYPSGIVVGWYFDRSGGTDPARYSKIIVSNNSIQTNGELSTGISSMSDGALIMENSITLNGGPGSKGITQLGSNGRIVRNTIRGAGAWALGALPYKEFKGNGNTFEQNDVSKFTASKADFYCQGNGNTFIGSKCQIVDGGEGNKMLVKN